jgi:hypothetical protein
MQSLYYRSDLYGDAEYNEAAAGQTYQQQQFYEQQQQTLAGYDQTGQYDQPPTPVNMVTQVRVTRARVRAAAAAAAPPPPPPPSGVLSFMLFWSDCFFIVPLLFQCPETNCMLNIKSMLGADIQYIETWILQSLNL